MTHFRDLAERNLFAAGKFVHGVFIRAVVARSLGDFGLDLERNKIGLKRIGLRAFRRNDIGSVDLDHLTALRGQLG